MAPARAIWSSYVHSCISGQYSRCERNTILHWHPGTGSQAPSVNTLNYKPFKSQREIVDSTHGYAYLNTFTMIRYIYKCIYKQWIENIVSGKNIKRKHWESAGFIYRSTFLCTERWGVSVRDNCLERGLCKSSPFSSDKLTSLINLLFSSRVACVNHKTAKLHNRNRYQRGDSTKMFRERVTTFQNQLVQRQHHHTRQ